jgi:hypothetical protein
VRGQLLGRIEEDDNLSPQALHPTSRRRVSMPYPRLGFLAPVIALMLLSVSPVWSDDLWLEKPPTEWTKKEAVKILRDSVWAQEVVVTHPPYRQEEEASGGIVWTNREGLSAPRPNPATESNYIVRYLVRWESARPVADAFERLAALGETEAARRLAAPMHLPEDRYAVTVFMTRPPVGYDLRDLLDDLDDAELRQRTWLEIRGRRVEPLEVERTRVGPIEALHFSFSRSPGGKPFFAEQSGEEKVQFGVKGRMFVLQTRFRLALDSLL